MMALSAASFALMIAGVGGPITGKGFNLGLIDDPHKNWQEAQSSTIRKMIQEWFDSTFYTRAEPGATIIVLMTRWHENDLVGYLLREKIKDGWFYVQDISSMSVAQASVPNLPPTGTTMIRSRS